ncbi:MAG: hypothetical protein M0Z41_09385 [Peptococcaceae bacterium]|nr:hypothetical protein [Peptococcaceae bacterium]
MAKKTARSGDGLRLFGAGREGRTRVDVRPDRHPPGRNGLPRRGAVGPDRHHDPGRE